LGNWQEILAQTAAGVPLADAAALKLFAAPLLSLGRAAAQIAAQKNPPGNIATFIIDRNINYTNICASKCKFCAFYREAGSADAYLLSNDEIYQKIAEAIAAGGTQIMLQGGLHPDLGLAYFENLVKEIKKRFAITIHSFSPAEIVHLAKKENLTVAEVLQRLKAAGLDSLPGGGAEILDDEVRLRVSPQKITTAEWLKVMAEAHHVGLKATATMVIGFGETLVQRINHLRRVRELQAETGVFRSFIIWSFQPGNTELGGEKITAWDYLRTLAISRLYLHNIQHLQGSWVTQGQAVGQLTLAFGADDLGSIMLEENVVRAAGTSYEMSVQKMVAVIEASGKRAAQRDTAYEILARCGN
jgi:cyclic dehypoxanthinyl futalosine synthase